SPTLVHPPLGPAPAVSNWIGSRPRHAVETGESSHDPIQLLTDDGAPTDEAVPTDGGASTDDGALTAREIADVGRLIRMTTTHSPSDPREALLSDADLSILGQIPGRYHVYVRDVRLDYAHLEDRAWRRGRAQVLEHLLAKEPLFHTELGRDLWETAARRNLAAELRSLAEPR
ncbi:HD domain-containing protein, partial [Tessaracoccus massiliensis]|uniref:HD domain-containing protein n=1 Tax=Tessaracoccus massiliensis TaxID=1522311 RepID=UPI003CCC689A